MEILCSKLQSEVDVKQTLYDSDFDTRNCLALLSPFVSKDMSTYELAQKIIRATRCRTQGKTIVSWNVDSLRSNILGSTDSVFGQLLRIYNPDIVCLQETKLQEKLEEKFIFDGYHTYFSSSTVTLGYSGVVILSKEEPKFVSMELDGIDDELKNEGRIITAYYEGYAIINTYVPNTLRAFSSAASHDYYISRRERWDAAMRIHLQKVKAEAGEVIWCGDLNVAMTMRDIYNGEKTINILKNIDAKKYNKSKIKEYENRVKDAKNAFEHGGGAGLTLEERKGLQNILDDGFVDSFRELYPLDYGFTYWNRKIPPYREADNGWRIDYFVTTPNLITCIESIQVLRMFGVDGKKVPSDHAPLVLKFFDGVVDSWIDDLYKVYKETYLDQSKNFLNAMNNLFDLSEQTRKEKYLFDVKWDELKCHEFGSTNILFRTSCWHHDVSAGNKNYYITFVCKKGVKLRNLYDYIKEIQQGNITYDDHVYIMNFMKHQQELYGKKSTIINHNRSIPILHFRLN